MANRKLDKCRANPDHPVIEDIKGITNVTGHVRGHANGSINFGDAVPAGKSRGSRPQKHTDKEKAELTKILAEAVGLLDGKSNDSAEGSQAPAVPVKKVRGLANITGKVRGVGNGGVNFGDILYEDVPDEDVPDEDVSEEDVPVSVPVKNVPVKNVSVKNGKPLKENSQNTKARKGYGQ